MRIDYTYLNEILQIFLNSELPTLTWNDFKQQRIEDEHKLVFHIEILKDNNLIVESLKDRSLGIRGISDNYMINLIPWRLSSDGHEFASSLNKPVILETITKNFKEHGLSIVMDLAKKIAVKRTEKFLNENT